MGHIVSRDYSPYADCARTTIRRLSVRKDQGKTLMTRKLVVFPTFSLPVCKPNRCWPAVAALALASHSIRAWTKHLPKSLRAFDRFHSASIQVLHFQILVCAFGKLSEAPCSASKITRTAQRTLCLSRHLNWPSCNCPMTIDGRCYSSTGHGSRHWRRNGGYSRAV